jgi:hypothetical protein
VSVFSHPEVIRQLTQAFVPVAENCRHLQNRQDAKGEFFRLVAAQGPRTAQMLPSAAWQGLYLCTVAGELLASGNPHDAPQTLTLIQQGLGHWPQRANQSTYLVIPESYEPDPRYGWAYPENGLVLKGYVRDLPRESGESNLWQWNLDYVWFTQEEAVSLVREAAEIGRCYPMPQPLVLRLVRFHLLDTVRGESLRWRSEHVKRAEVFLTVEERKGEQVKLRLEGRVRNEAPPDFEINPYNGKIVDMGRGIDLRLLGYLTYQRERQAFTRFDMIAVGLRWGATTYNDRFDDLGPAPIGFAFELAGTTSIERTPPQAIRFDYWQPFSAGSCFEGCRMAREEEE